MTITMSTITTINEQKVLWIKNRVAEYLQDLPSAKQYLQYSFAAFVQAFHYLRKGEYFYIKSFHKELIKDLEDIASGNQKNLLIEMSPRSGKSELINYYICWTYTLNPFCNNIYTCYSDELVGKFSKTMREIVDREEYKNLFNLSLSSDTKAVGLWKLKNGGETRAVSINGAMTGFGAGVAGSEYGGCLVVDDPIKPQEARSEVMRKKLIDYFVETIESRRNNLALTPTIVTMQRVHKYDLAGYLEDEISKGKRNPDKWKIHKVSAIRPDGTSFWEERYPIAELEEKRKNNPYMFNSQYQQTPISEQRNFFNLDMFVETKIPDEFDYSYITADTAYKDGQDNDYTVFSFFGVKDKKLYLADILRDKMQAVEIEKRIIPFIRKNTSYGFEGCFIEPKGHGIYLNQSLASKNIIMPRQSQIDEFFKDRKFDKVTRANAIMPFFTNNKLYINQDLLTRTKNDIVDELISFPDGLHDDIEDTICDGIKKYMEKEMYKRNVWAL